MTDRTPTYRIEMTIRDEAAYGPDAWLEYLKSCVMNMGGMWLVMGIGTTHLDPELGKKLAAERARVQTDRPEGELVAWPDRGGFGLRARVQLPNGSFISANPQHIVVPEARIDERGPA